MVHLPETPASFAEWGDPKKESLIFGHPELGKDSLRFDAFGAYDSSCGNEVFRVWGLGLTDIKQGCNSISF